MADYYDQGAHSRYNAQIPQQAAGGQVEWYQASAGQAYSTYSYDTSTVPSTSGGAYGSFEEEPPLLEELGIDLSGIFSKSIAVLTSRVSHSTVENLDLGGPLLIATALASVHLLAGKLHFGVILGWSVVGGMVVWFVASNLGVGPEDGPAGDARLSLYDCCCLLGYCLVPMLLHALVALLLPSGVLALAAAALAALWSSHTAARLFVKRAPHLREHFYLVAYPCLLMYSAFALLTAYEQKKS